MSCILLLPKNGGSNSKRELYSLEQYALLRLLGWRSRIVCQERIRRPTREWFGTPPIPRERRLTVESGRVDEAGNGFMLKRKLTARTDWTSLRAERPAGVGCGCGGGEFSRRRHHAARPRQLSCRGAARRVEVWPTWRTSLNLRRGDWGAFRVRCAAHRIKIKAGVRCAMCPFLYRSLLKPRDRLVDDRWRTLSASHYFFSIFDNSWMTEPIQALLLRGYTIAIITAHSLCHRGRAGPTQAPTCLQVLQYIESRMFCQREITTDEFEIRDGKNVQHAQFKLWTLCFPRVHRRLWSYSDGEDISMTSAMWESIECSSRRARHHAELQRSEDSSYGMKVAELERRDKAEISLKKLTEICRSEVRPRWSCAEYVSEVLIIIEA